VSRPRSADGTEGSLDARQRSRNMTIGSALDTLSCVQPATRSLALCSPVSRHRFAVPAGFGLDTDSAQVMVCR
jgi:hypothetical protein